MTESLKDGPSSTRPISLTATGEIWFDHKTESGSVPGRRYALLIFCGDAAQHVLLDGSGVVIGRESPSEIVVADPSVSRQHARFAIEDGLVFVEDLRSRNGTFVAGERVRKRRLAPADEVRVGKARVVLAATVGDEAHPDTAAALAEPPVLRNARMQKLYEQAVRAAQSKAPVLVLGETGTGKELVATAIHSQGPRSKGPFVVINCAAIPASLVESTLFGHERGAFTGAVQRGLGVFERADGGVLFLDEVGELGAGAQAALLRVIETRRVCRVGASNDIAVDVRLVAATHCDLRAMIEEGTFREDLYYRLSGIVLEVPPLRERRDDIEPMVRYFLSRTRAEWGASADAIEPDALGILQRYPWPGNVRQLRHAVERAALIRGSGSIRVTDLPDYLFRSGSGQQRLRRFEHDIVDLALKPYLLRCERDLIEEALRRAGRNRELAAKLLRVSSRTLFRRMRACGVAEDTSTDS